MNANFDITAMDMNELESVKAKLKQRFPELIKHYLEDAAKYIKGIEEGLAGGDLNVIATNAHPLKSSSAAIGVSGVSDIAKTLELAAKEGEEIDAIQPLLVPLKDALDYAMPKLQALLDDMA